MKGVAGIADDMIIYSATEQEHDENFLNFMEKCMINNLTHNAGKIQFKQSQVSFCGHCWSKSRISPDPKKIEALNHMKFPGGKETMRSFLGIVNYLNKYSAQCAHLCAPFSALTHQNKDYKSTEEHIKLFECVKKEVSKIGALPYFDVNAKPILQMDASKKCLGACLIKNNVVVSFASHALTKA